MSPITTDVQEQLAGSLSLIFHETVTPLLHGSEGDLLAYATTLATRLSQVLLSDSQAVRRAMLYDITSSLVAEGEAQGIAAERSSWFALETIIRVSGNVLLATANAQG